MSNLKKRLNKTASNSNEIAAKIYEIFTAEIKDRADEISWPEDKLDGCVEIAEMNMVDAIGLGVDKFVEAMLNACDEWQKDTATNYPDGPEE